MTTKITWLGHAAFSLDIDGQRVLIDPFLSGNPKAAATHESLPADYILVSHGHGDHIGDTVAIAHRTGAKVIANTEIIHWLIGKEVANTHSQHIGGGYHHPFGYLKLTIAHHGSRLPDGGDGGNPAGFLITTLDGHKIYFAGDTGLFLSMSLYGDEGIDLALLPIGDNFTMGPDDALRAVKLLRPKTVIPMHFGTWKPIEQDAAAWVERVNAETESQAVLLHPGDTFTLG
ncbi:MAG: metal-dependent hydrolase [Anaerolineae bacterium]|nr:metal-dependent hydrolase [Anaerolineae bacterium]